MGSRANRAVQPGKPGDSAKPEEPKTIQHPTKPPKPPDPEELKVRPDADGKLQFNFNNQPWQPVLEWLAEDPAMSLDWQELPGDYLNLKSQQRYTVSETRDLINLHLLARGYTLLCNGEVLSVANIKKLDPSRVPRVTPEELDHRDPHEFVKVSFPLDWLMADAIIEELNPMKSPNGKLTPLKSTNRLEALDAVIKLARDTDVVKRRAVGRQPAAAGAGVRAAICPGQRSPRTVADLAGPGCERRGDAGHAWRAQSAGRGQSPAAAGDDDGPHAAAATAATRWTARGTGRGQAETAYYLGPESAEKQHPGPCPAR